MISFKWGRPFRSVYTKLFLIIFATGILLFIGIGSIYFQAVREGRVGIWREHAALYLNHLIDEIGSPPNLAVARQLSEQTNLGIRYQSPTEKWFTAEQIPTFQQAQKWTWRERSGVRFGWWEGTMVMVVEREQDTFVFIQLYPEGTGFGTFWVFVMLGGVILILSGTYATLRWLFRPLRDLSRVVKLMSAGDLEHRVPEYRNDQFGRLSEAFNRMTKRIQHMITARERLLLDVSHELRSPLTRMKVALEFFPESDIRRGVALDVDEMETMVTGILENARLHSEYGTLRLAEFNLVPLLQEVMTEFREQPPGLHFPALPSSLLLTADAEQVRSVLKNLLANALKFSTPESAPVDIRVQTEQQQIVIEVVDHGVGITQDDQAFIFEPFYRTDSSRKNTTGGYGLGLSLCKTIMEAHQGSISMTSEPGRGSVFRVSFPG
jgi:signal transduction histidine kinase